MLPLLVPFGLSDLLDSWPLDLEPFGLKLPGSEAPDLMLQVEQKVDWAVESHSMAPDFGILLGLLPARCLVRAG